jgi:Lrp/AsnC family transcriptional regulator for asnA, asnC and gidA
MKMKTLSKKEMDIMVYLRSNSRHTVTQIGRKLGMPRTTVFDKIKKFKNLGLINKFTAIVDFDKLGHSVCAYVLLKCDAAKKEELGEALASSAHANNVVKLGNDFDFAAHLIFENMNDMHSYLNILEQKYGIREIKIFYIAKDLKREGFMANTDSCIAVEEAEEL